MKKTLVFITLLMLITSALTSCAKKETINNTNEPGKVDTDIIEREQTFDQNLELAADIFMGSVSKVEDVPEGANLPNYPGNYKMKLCTVKVEKVYLPFVVEKGMTIHVICPYEPISKAGEDNAQMFEKGKTYLMSGLVQPYSNRPVIAAVANMSVEVGEDGTLTPISSAAQEMYKGLSTLKQLENDKSFINLCENGKPYLPLIFYIERGEEYDWENTAKYDDKIAKAIKEIKAILPIDSKEKLSIEYDNYGVPYTP